MAPLRTEIVTPGTKRGKGQRRRMGVNFAWAPLTTTQQHQEATPTNDSARLAA